MESKTCLRDIKISPKKMRFLISDLKSMKPVESLEVLKYTHKKPAQIFRKAIMSAVNNAVATLKVSDSMLKFKSLAIDEGRKLKRYRAGSKGSPKRYTRRYSHITIVLESN